MRLPIKNATNEKGANGADKSNGAHGTNGVHRETRVDRALRSSALFRRAKASAGDLAEALLQILSGTTPYLPNLHVRETEEGIDVSATLSGIDEDSLQVAFEGQFLRVNGMKTRLREQTRRKYRRVQKVYRTFERMIPIYCDVDRDKAVATLRSDILRIHVPKSAASRASVESVHIDTESSPTS